MRGQTDRRGGLPAAATQWLLALLSFDAFGVKRKSLTVMRFQSRTRNPWLPVFGYLLSVHFNCQFWV